jgi:hypothetical protein
LNRNGFFEAFSDAITLNMGYFRNDDDEGDFEDADDYFNMELLELLGNNVLYRIHESDSEYSDFTEQSLLEMFDEYFSGF